MSLSEEKLNIEANHIYKEEFGRDFDGFVVWSKKMKNIAGNCRSDGRIALNYYYYERYGEEEIMKVLRHELAHHYCFSYIGRHTHSTPLFLDTLEKLGGEQKGKPMPVTGYIYACPNCCKEWIFYRRLNNRKLSCSSCGEGSYRTNYKIQFISETIIEPDYLESIS